MFGYPNPVERETFRGFIARNKLLIASLLLLISSVAIYNSEQRENIDLWLEDLGLKKPNSCLTGFFPVEDGTLPNGVQITTESFLNGDLDVTPPSDTEEQAILTTIKDGVPTSYRIAFDEYGVFCIQETE